ncbi:MAG TPA: hypothetical protein VFS92_08570 [Planctomycetota bacterium]|nr:hypothetical protein [Planctomycetota bacterium]
MIREASEQATDPQSNLRPEFRSTETETVRLATPGVSGLNVSSFPPTRQLPLSLAPFVNLLGIREEPLRDYWINDAVYTVGQPPSDSEAVTCTDKKTGKTTRACTDPKIVARFKEIKAIRRAGGTVTGQVYFLGEDVIYGVSYQDSA